MTRSAPMAGAPRGAPLGSTTPAVTTISVLSCLASSRGVASKQVGRHGTSCPTTACISSRDKAATLPSPLDGEAPDDGSRSRASGDPLQQEVVGNQHRAVPDLNREVGRAGVTSKADALSLATVVNGNTVFTFDTGDVLIVENIADPNLLRDDIVIV